MYRGRFKDSHIDGECQIITKEYTYLGKVNKGIMEGQGTIKYQSGDSYQGEFARNQRHGYGVYKFKDGG